MASLVVLERHLWLKVTDNVPFFNSPVSPTGLFGPAVEGFAERFTAALKSSQAMRHLLPKCSSSAAASSLPKMASTQQPVKASSAVHGLIQTLSPSPPQSFSEDAGPYGLSVFGTSVGPALRAPPSVLAKTSSSSTRLASRTPSHHGEPRPALQLWPLGRTVSGWNGASSWAWGPGQIRGLLLRGTLTKPTSEQ